MLKRALALGIVAGLLAALVSTIYAKIYSASLGVDFSRIAKPSGIFICSTIGTVLASFCYWGLSRLLKQGADIIFNLLFVILSFATLPAVFGAKLPLDLSSPELFPGMVIPMHFFPALGWLTLKPLFIRQKNLEKEAVRL